MRVLFLFPEHYLNIGIPGGVSILSAILKQHGHAVNVFDTTFLKTDPDFDRKRLHADIHGGNSEADKAGMQQFKKTAYTLEDLVRNDPVVRYEEELQKTIDSFSPDLIAVSTMTSTFDFAMNLLRKVRYKAKVIVGGVHPTIAVDDCLAQKEVDIACIGEGDDVLAELCDLMEAGKDYTNVKSMYFKMPDGSIKKNPLAPRVDLNDLPCPDWGLFDERHLFRPFEGVIYKGSFYVQSRGCPQQCTYCINPTVSKMSRGDKSYFRVQKPSVTISHIAEFREKFGATWFKFADDSFLLPPNEHLEELREGLKPLGIKFGCSVMPNTITEEKVNIAKDMGCVAMTVGVESGNAGIRKMIKRNYNDEQLIRNLKIIQDFGIKLSTFNIIGFPGETRENVFETIEINKKIGTSACNVYILFPYPGTPIQKEFNIPIRDKDGKIFPVSRAKEFRLSKMTPEELEGLQNTFNLYLNLPKTLWPLIRLAESTSGTGPSLLVILRRFATALISSETIDLKPVTSVLPEAAVKQHPCDFRVPALLSEIFTLPLGDAMGTALDACRNYSESP
ncbi:MAG: B12-binding domain-containing radical SAM protein [Dissulfurispiraceae bacterium]